MTILMVFAVVRMKLLFLLGESHYFETILPFPPPVNYLLGEKVKLQLWEHR